ncbi:MAG: FtsQ-type POTRA domain-containing protein [Chloroflexota bacterium]
MSPRKPSTRADSVRRRRKREDERRLVAQSLERPTRRRAAATPPAVSAIPKVSVDAATVRATSRPARQYQALAAAPARSGLRTPSMPRVRVGWRLLSFFLVLVFGAAVYYAYTDPMFRVGNAALAGNRFLSADEVNAALGVAGLPIYFIVPEEAETALRLTFPEITSARVTVDLPNVLNVTIVERQPVIRWEQGNAYTWLDEEGVALRPRGDAPDLVVVQASGGPPAGPKSESDPLAPIPFANADLVKTARLLAPYSPQASTLLYDPQNGIGWSDPRGWTVWFGSTSEQVDMKLRVYIVLVESLSQRGIAPVMINVAYLNAPYYRLGQ